ncbi:Ribosomal protein S9 [Corchorus olitorius]|uniref:Small ribosomal subunit protein uS9c n=1 Tax=Corchorus olitorius TaxID=93759 RepID=A0A1R3HXH1_9ROSI|nr:Ribosomal protein S9 [Corchorus olitorius]
MALSISSLTSSFSSLSFSSQISRNSNSLSIPQPPKSLPVSLFSKPARSLSIAATVAAPPESEPVEDLKKYVKTRLPGGFAAQTITGTGRRKCAIARVVLQEGTGKFIINYRDAKEYLQGNPLWLQYVKVPLVTLGYETSYDVFVKAHGGGLSGQAQAISLGIARALLKVSADHRSPLKKEGLLTRDSRVVERKKVGLKKARDHQGVTPGCPAGVQLPDHQSLFSSQSSDSTFTCYICYEDVSADMMTVMDCGHYFCNDYQQQQFEANVEKLSSILEEKFDTYSEDDILSYRMRVCDQSRTTDNLCQHLYEYIETDLLGSLQTVHSIAPYRSKGLQKASS